MNGKVKESHLLGKAGEHLVAAELLAQGLIPAWPSHDDGCDLFVTNGCRIQVKTSRARASATCARQYTFHFKHRSFSAHSATKVAEYPKRKLSEYCDFVVLVGWDERRFWVVPSEALNDIHCAYTGSIASRDFEKDIPQMLEMAKLGYSQKEIGKHYGINQSSVYERLKLAGTPRAYKKFMGLLRSCEGRWEQIADFKPIRTVDSPVESVGIQAEGQEE